jgi:N-acetylglucosamine malate deacetylase 1
MNKRVLVVTAHPDDLENGIGGTLTRLVQAGYAIYSVVATLPTDPVQKGIRRQESIRAHAILHSDHAHFIFWDEPDGALEVNSRTRALMQDVYDVVEPDLVLTLWPADVHPDHRAVADLAMGPALARGVNTEPLCFEVCSSGRGTAEFRPQSIGFFPTHYVHTTPVQKEKYALMECHESQDPNGMWAGMRNVHANRAHEVGGLTSYAEGFVRLTRCGEMSQELGAIFQKSPSKLRPRGIGVDFKPETIGISL